MLAFSRSGVKVLLSELPYALSKDQVLRGFWLLPVANPTRCNDTLTGK